MKNQNITFTTIALTLACLGFLTSNAFGVNPAPDGGYPGFNTAEGQNALLSLSTGQGNTAVGWFSLKSNTEGSFNTATGAGTLLLNTGDENTATGAGALLNNTSGVKNSANGAFALLSNTEGADNTALGWKTLFNNTTGNESTAVGSGALFNNTTGSNNVANGFQALLSNTEGSNNTATGRLALATNSTGSYNTANGSQALLSNTEGGNNTANGLQALIHNTTGSNNVANGFQALLSNTEGGNNTANGLQALFFNTTGSGNTALGGAAGNGVTTADNVIAIGTGGANVSNSCFIGNIRGVTTANANAIPVLIDSAGQLGTASSSRRFKKEIKPMDQTSKSILGLKPVTFHYKSDKTSAPQFGLIAEEVAEVNPDLVVRDDKGDIYTVRYDAVNAMLLNEFLKEHHTVEEQQSKIDNQQASITALKETVAQQQESFESKLVQQGKRIETLTFGLQKLSAQLAEASPSRGGVEAKKPAPQIASLSA